MKNCPHIRFLEYSDCSHGNSLKAPSRFFSGKPFACGLRFALKKYLGNLQTPPTALLLHFCCSPNLSSSRIFLFNMMASITIRQVSCFQECSFIPKDLKIHLGVLIWPVKSNGPAELCCSISLTLFNVCYILNRFDQI